MGQSFWHPNLVIYCLNPNRKILDCMASTRLYSAWTDQNSLLLPTPKLTNFRHNMYINYYINALQWNHNIIQRANQGWYLWSGGIQGIFQLDSKFIPKILGKTMYLIPRSGPTRNRNPDPTQKMLIKNVSQVQIGFGLVQLGKFWFSAIPACLSFKTALGSHACEHYNWSKEKTKQNKIIFKKI